MPRLVLLIFALTLAGCGAAQKFKDGINEQFPPLTLDVQRDYAIRTADAALATMPLPDLVAMVELDSVQEELASEDWTEYGIDQLRVAGEQQLIKISVEFTLSNAGDSKSADWFRGLEVLENVPVSIKGKATLYFGITGVYASNDAGEEFLDLNIIPRAHRFAIRKVTIGKFDQFTTVFQTLSGVINHFSDRLNGSLSKEALTSVAIPRSFSGEIRAGEIAGWSENGSIGKVELQGESIGVPIQLVGIAPLVDKERVALLAQFAPEGAELSFGEELASDDHRFVAFRKRFYSAVQRSFGKFPDDSDAFVGVRKDLLEYVINQSFLNTQICLAGSSLVPKQSFKNKISLPHEDAINCASERDCNIKRDCSKIKKSEYKRSCRACLLKLFGRCQKKGNDPFCELEKAGKNAIYQADYEARVFDCNRIREMKRAACLAERTTETALCEAGKEVVKRINRTGNFANISGSVKGAGQLTACLVNLRADEGLTHLRANLSVSGKAKMDASLRFVPLDIVGHLTCQAPFTEDRTLEVNVAETAVEVSAVLAETELDGALGLEYEIAPSKIHATLQPGPTEILLTSVNSTLACQGLNLVKPLIINITPFVPELRGQFEYKPDPIRVRQEFELPHQIILGQEVVPSLEERAESYLLTATRASN